MTSERIQALLNQLLVEDLSGVTFVRDYIQLQFNPPPLINVYSRCSVVTNHGRFFFGEPDFANAVIAQIGRNVVSVAEAPGEVLIIRFDDTSAIEIPFGEGTFEGPEALEFWGKDQKCGFWPG